MEESLQDQGKALSSDLQSLNMVLARPQGPPFFDPGVDYGEPGTMRPQVAGVTPVETLLALNLEYQEVIKEQLFRIETSRERNKALKKLLARSFVPGGKIYIKKPSSAAKFAAGDAQPQLNRDAERKVEHEIRFPSTFKGKAWPKSEKALLNKKIYDAVQLRLIEQVQEKYQELPATAANTKNMDREQAEVNEMSFEEAVSRVDEIPWHLISLHMRNRTPEECRLFWENNMRPGINHAKWTKEEDKALFELAQRYKGHEWEAVAQALGTGRLPWQCCSRFQRSLNASMLKGKWSEDEDLDLARAVKLYGEKNWQQVANCLDGRTGQQCLHRWQKTLKPNIRKGRWTAEEDKALTLAVKAYGNKNWINVQRHVPCRTDVQCRERWMNVLNPHLKLSPWTTEEDRKLNALTKKYGPGRWSIVAQEIGSRTDNQCWRRWKALNQTTVSSYRQKLKKRKSSLMGNFVGREKERPEVSPEDMQVAAFSAARFAALRSASEQENASEGQVAPMLSFDVQDYPQTYDPDRPSTVLPLLLPSTETSGALQQLVRHLPNAGPPELPDEVRSHPEFRLLESTFNSLFLCSALLFANQYSEYAEDTLMAEAEPE